MKRFSQLRRNLKNLRQGIWRNGNVIGFINIVERHSICQTLQNERDRQSFKDPAIRQTLLEAHIFNTEATALKNLYIQESRLRRQYTRDLRELDKLRAERAEVVRKQESKLAWEREKEFIWDCDCDDCRNLARHIFPQPRRSQSIEDKMASNFQIECDNIESAPDGIAEDR